MNKKIIQKNITKLEELDKNIPINLVLSGGGVKSTGHLALLEKIEALGLKINAIAGSSGGALVASLYASGVPTKDILKVFKETSIFKISFFSISKAGIFDTLLFRNAIENKIKSKFSELQIPIYITASNMQEGKIRYFSKGKLLKPILASCAIPGIFSPIKINNVLYSDGGVLDNFPIKPFEKSDLPLIGSYVSDPPKRTQEELNSTLKVVTQATYLMAHSAVSFKFYITDLTIRFPLSNYSGLDTKEAEEIYKKCKSFLKTKQVKKTN
ncbi:patatin-like phospholipase family protein [Polaribacter sp. Hel1_85]|uniref:patatin-like phospholipase family protein n=1 Tax=Polaribacter sp. Hel1_85 TaxID=1250005 RepID=UPI00052C3B18|nr:patatin-like phospholipase family protein [Polaribacter sp. Hel1_85]KGL63413.1 phospholipase [Polaribacter sp. Hel1_85]